MLEIQRVGFAPTFVPYLDGWALQRRVHAGVVSGDHPDTLLLLEHQAVYTAGTRTEPHDRPTDGTPVLDVDRGGRITWHGPGQLVGYPVLRLPKPLDVVAHVRRLEDCLIRALAALDVSGMRVAGRSGVWVAHASGVDKVAAIGVRVEKGVSMHGFAVNADNDLAPFGAIVPCGITDAGVTSLSRVAGRRIGVVEVADAVEHAFAHAHAARNLAVPA